MTALPEELREAVERARELLAAATPGPWRVNTWAHRDAATRVEDTGSGGLIADCHAHRAPDRNEGNARLIAAAPDLLTVLANLDVVERWAFDAKVDELRDVRSQLDAASTMLAEAEKIVPGVITTAGRMSLGLNDRERANAYEDALWAIATADWPSEYGNEQEFARAVVEGRSGSV